MEESVICTMLKFSEKNTNFHTLVLLAHIYYLHDNRRIFYAYTQTLCLTTASRACALYTALCWDHGQWCALPAPQFPPTTQDGGRTNLNFLAFTLVLSVFSGENILVVFLVSDLEILNIAGEENDTVELAGIFWFIVQQNMYWKCQAFLCIGIF